MEGCPTSSPVQRRVPSIAKRAVSEMGGSKQVSDKMYFAINMPVLLCNTKTPQIIENVRLKNEFGTSLEDHV
jgi:hypothetical protein